MPPLTDAEIASARAVDLLAYLQIHEPASIKKYGQGEYCLREHDSLKISNGKWFWFSRGFGSNNALDFLIQVRGFTFVNAVQTLTGGRSVDYTPPSSRSPPAKEKLPPLFILPTPNRDNFRVTAYLMQRGISQTIVNRCIQNKILYESKIHHACVFVGKNRDGKFRFACKRSIKGDFKQDVMGSDKRYSFSSSPHPASQTVLNVFESPIEHL